MNLLTTAIKRLSVLPVVLVASTLVTSPQAEANMAHYKQCRQQAFANMALSSKTPFFLLGLANQMNDCLKHLSPAQRAKIEKEREQDNFSSLRYRRHWG